MKTPVYSGIITNYNCTAECEHCMFASSPSCAKEYITKEKAEEIARILKEAGTYSVHIGGGEPFINFMALCMLIKALNEFGIGIDYIETNAFWCRDEKAAREKLKMLKALGVSTIMVSVDPFHIEFVPLELPLKLCGLLNELGFEYFIWQQKFLKRLSALDITVTHTKDELMEALGEDYIVQTAAEYGLGINGRALCFADSIYPKRPYEYWATDEECPSLTHPHHCHIDLYGRAIPSRCTGIFAEARDYLETNIPKDRYPVFASLLESGTKGLYEYAKSKGFIAAKNGYPTRCAFCYDMRRYLYENCPSQDICDKSFYDSMKKRVCFD